MNSKYFRFVTSKTVNTITEEVISIKRYWVGDKPTRVKPITNQMGWDLFASTDKPCDGLYRIYESKSGEMVGRGFTENEAISFIENNPSIVDQIIKFHFELHEESPRYNSNPLYKVHDYCCAWKVDEFKQFLINNQDHFLMIDVDGKTIKYWFNGYQFVHNSKGKFDFAQQILDCCEWKIKKHRGYVYADRSIFLE